MNHVGVEQIVVAGNRLMLGPLEGGFDFARDPEGLGVVRGQGGAMRGCGRRVGLDYAERREGRWNRRTFMEAENGAGDLGQHAGLSQLLGRYRPTRDKMGDQATNLREEGRDPGTEAEVGGDLGGGMFGAPLDLEVG